ncbi:hypothetical protein EUGRSUZ_D01825 [Eucalyptus grandis]|uniref:Uncharacterized protein n=2 Tax=Eucalyptus grandis TaxID=71139 RepID=A0ACC3L716_EUCGR|nr:hypothetical protein EUGRSUZ_D01825 [Eucalyptus grandis]
MNGKVSNVAPSSVMLGNRGCFIRGRPLPKRGQIKYRIAATAFHSIATAIARAASSSHRQHSSSCKKEFFRES